MPLADAATLSLFRFDCHAAIFRFSPRCHLLSCRLLPLFAAADAFFFRFDCYAIRLFFAMFTCCHAFRFIFYAADTLDYELMPLFFRFRQRCRHAAMLLPPLLLDAAAMLPALRRCHAICCFRHEGALRC